MGYDGYQGAGGRVHFDFDGSLELARQLWALADELEMEDVDRQRDCEIAQARWRGAYRTDFDRRRGDECTSARIVVEGLRADARSWAKAWAAARYQQNKNDRVAAVLELKKELTVGEKLWDAVTPGDYADGFVAPAIEVDVPVPPRFLPTAG